MTAEREGTATVRWMVLWNIWPTEDDQERMFQGPYDSRSEAEDAAQADYRRVDTWHDAAWTVAPLYDGDLPGIRYDGEQSGSTGDAS